jgi:hypothetical protein
MSYRSRTALEQGAIISEAPAFMRPNRGARTFGLHPVLFAATIGAYLAFLAALAVGFMVPALVIPFAVFLIYIAMAFGVPGLWAHVAPKPVGRVPSWSEFRAEGMDLETGHVASGAAIAQVLVLPGLIALFGVAVAIIAAVA